MILIIKNLPSLLKYNTIRSKFIPKTRFWGNFQNENVCSFVCGFIWIPFWFKGPRPYICAL